MKPYCTLILHFAFCILTLYPCLCGSSLAADRPNILFIMTDDHAAHAMSCYGSRINQTPHLDRIAREGMRFTNCFVTNSICTPSRATILTGKYSHKNGVSVFNRFDGSQTTFPKLLQQAGYQTAVIGKWHLFSDPTGFDYWNILPGQGLYHDPELIEMGQKKKHKGYATDVITDLSLDWLKRRDPKKPFCLLYHHKAPHREWSPDEKHAELFENDDRPVPDNFFDDYAGRSPAAAEATMRVGRDMTKRDLKRSPPPGLAERERALWNYQRYIKDYLRCVASVDDNVGRMLEYLDREGLAKNTIVIYTSDQGFFLGEHGWYDKRFMYEESLRMPLLVRYPPSIKPGATSEKMVLNIDFAPTLLELAGIAPPAEMQGRSFKSLLEGQPAPSDWRTSMYYRYYHYPAHHRVQPHYGVRTERHKLIYFPLAKFWELFDLEIDPREMHNVYADAKYADVARKLKSELTRLKAHYGDDDSHKPPRDEGDRAPKVPPDQVKQQLAAHYDFSNARVLENGGADIVDSSGHSNHARLASGEIVAGRRGKALKLTGDRPAFSVPTTNELNPAQKPLTVGCWFKADSTEGVLMAHGGNRFGWRLELKEFGCASSILAFQVNSNDPRRPRAGESRVLVGVKFGEWTHVAATIQPDGKLELFVNGDRIDYGDPQKQFIAARPADGLSIGGDSGSQVVDSEVPPFSGLLEDVRIYWGALDEVALRNWADKPTTAVWGRWEQLFTAAEKASPDTAFNVAITSPKGEKIEIPGFWDGGTTWRVRFMPDSPGEWKFAARSQPSIKGLDGESGTFEVRAATRSENRFIKHGAIQVSKDGYYLMHADGTPFFWLGDTAWNGPNLSTDDDWQKYLANRVENRFTGVQFNVVCPWRTAPADEIGEVAFTGTKNVAINPKFYQRLDRRIDALNAAGLLAMPVLMWANSRKDPGNVLGDGDVTRLIRYQVARYGAHDVLWCLAGDNGYRGRDADRWKKIGREIFGRGARFPVTTHPTGMNWPWEDWRGESWLTVYGYQSGHGDDAANMKWIHSGPIAQNWRNKPPRPIINLEPPYEDHIAYQSRKPHSAYNVRRAVYWSLLNAPPAGVTYGGHGIWSWQTKPGVPRDHGGTGLARPWHEAVKLPGNTEMKHMAGLFTSLPWWQLRPANEILREQPGVTDPARFVAAAATEDRKTLVAYTPKGDPVALDAKAISADANKSRWFNPRTGRFDPAASNEPGKFAPPTRDEDWIFLIQY
jgi:arylsulfatase A-like enzyme